MLEIIGGVCAVAAVVLWLITTFTRRQEPEAFVLERTKKIPKGEL
jgi:hypothetical protein